jgi:hypothetical protein
MDDSLADWLSLRAPADTAARSVSLTAAVSDALGIPSGGAIRLLDLGSGTGSNVRYLSPRLLTPQEWLLVDRDPALLAGGPKTAGAVFIDTRVAELGSLDEAMFKRRNLVTASALLDLVSESWIEQVAARCRENRSTALFALTYNGQSHCVPAEPEDDRIRDWLNEHQRQNDKGFGRAAGPDAVASTVRMFSEAGYRVVREPSNWDLRPSAKELQRQLVLGWAEAAAEIAPDQALMIEGWLARRLAHVDENRSHIVVGHDDIAAFYRF